MKKNLRKVLSFRGIDAYISQEDYDITYNNTNSTIIAETKDDYYGVRRITIVPTKWLPDELDFRLHARIDEMAEEELYKQWAWSFDSEFRYQESGVLLNRGLIGIHFRYVPGVKERTMS